MEHMTFMVLLLLMCVFFLSDHILSVHALHFIPSTSHMLHLIQSSHYSPFLTLLNSPNDAVAIASNPSDTILLLLDQLFIIAPHGSISSSSISVDMNSLTIGSSSSQVLVPSLVVPTTTYSDAISSITEQIHHAEIVSTVDLPWTHDIQSSSAIISQASDLSLNGPQLQQQIDSLRDIINVYATKYSEVITRSSLQLFPSLGDYPSSGNAAQLFDTSVVSTIINEVIAALTRATSSFNTQLSQKGNELVANTQSSLSSFATSLPNEAINSAVSSISNKVISIGRWKLFSDDNHWEDGYWEQRLTSLARLLVELEQVENRRRYIDGLAGAVSESISGVGPRFIDQYNAKRAEYRELDAQVVAAWESVKTSVEQVGRIVSDDEQRSTIIDAVGRSLDGFTSRFIDRYDEKRAEYKDFDEAILTLWDQLTSVMDITAKALRTYVDDFISTGQDL